MKGEQEGVIEVTYGGDRHFEECILLSNFDVVPKQVFDKIPEEQFIVFQFVNTPEPTLPCPAVSFLDQERNQERL